HRASSSGAEREREVLYRREQARRALSILRAFFLQTMMLPPGLSKIRHPLKQEVREYRRGYCHYALLRKETCLYADHMNAMREQNLRSYHQLEIRAGFSSTKKGSSRSDTFLLISASRVFFR